jgi:hypothetical protein
LLIDADSLTGLMKILRHSAAALLALLLIAVGTPRPQHQAVPGGHRPTSESQRGGMVPDGSREAVIRAAAGVAVVPTPSHARAGTTKALTSTAPLVVVPSHLRLESSRFTFARPFDPPHLHPFALLI